MPEIRWRVDHFKKISVNFIIIEKVVITGVRLLVRPIPSAGIGMMDDPWPDHVIGRVDGNRDCPHTGAMKPNFFLVTLMGMALAMTAANSADLKEGDAAPEFELKGSDGKTYKLSELKGKAVVVAWYPKAFTGG